MQANRGAVCDTNPQDLYKAFSASIPTFTFFSQGGRVGLTFPWRQSPFPVVKTFHPDSVYRAPMAKRGRRSPHLGEQPLRARKAHPMPPGSQPRPHPAQRLLQDQVNHQNPENEAATAAPARPEPLAVAPVPHPYQRRPPESPRRWQWFALPLSHRLPVRAAYRLPLCPCQT